MTESNATQLTEGLKYSCNQIIITIFIIGLMTIVGYIFSMEWLISWGTYPMAINTAICLILISVALFILNNGKR